MMERLWVWLRAEVRRFALWLLAWVDACPTCGAPWSAHLCPYDAAGTAARQCEICGVPLPASALRTHDGRWRCRAHKNG